MSKIGDLPIRIDDIQHRAETLQRDLGVLIDQLDQLGILLRPRADNIAAMIEAINRQGWSVTLRQTMSGPVRWWVFAGRGDDWVITQFRDDPVDALQEASRMIAAKRIANHFRNMEQNIDKTGNELLAEQE